MKLSTSLVAVKKINSTVPRSSFSDAELNRAAELILKAEGIINPLVLYKTSMESYEVVNGHFEYYAATKAREIEPRQGEMIGAFIIEPEKEEVLKEQIEVLRLKTDDTTKRIKEQLEQLESSFKDELRNFTKNLEEVMSKQIESIRHALDETREF